MLSFLKFLSNFNFSLKKLRFKILKINSEIKISSKNVRAEYTKLVNIFSSDKKNMLIGIKIYDNKKIKIIVDLYFFI